MRFFLRCRAFSYEYFLFATLNFIHTEILRLPECNKLDGKFSEIHKNQRLVGSVIRTFKKENLGGCISKCFEFPKCKSVNLLDFTEESMQATGVCELNSEDCHSNGKAKLKSRKNSTIAQTPKTQPNVSQKNVSCPLCVYI